MDFFSELPGLSSEKANDFSRRCLEAWKAVRDPVAAYCLGCAIERFASSIDPEHFESAGVEKDSRGFSAAAFNRFEELAGQGSWPAARWLAVYYQGGLYPACENYGEMAKWLRVAMDLGDPTAKGELLALEGRGASDSTAQ